MNDKEYVFIAWISERKNYFLTTTQKKIVIQNNQLLVGKKIPPRSVSFFDMLLSLGKTNPSKK